MKKALGLSLLGLVVFVSLGLAEPPADFKPPKTSAELELIKSLAGRWEGAAPEKSGHGDKVVVEYRVTSGGSAVTETMSPGTPHEMVSVYHDVNGKLTMEHYCMLGNQPQMELKDVVAGKISLVETPASGSSLSGQMRMNSVTIEQPDKNTMIQSWTGLNADGTPMDPVVLKVGKV